MIKSRAAFNLIGKNRLIALLAPESEADCLRAYEELEPLGIVLELAFRTRAAARRAVGLRQAARPQGGALRLRTPRAQGEASSPVDLQALPRRGRRPGLFRLGSRLARPPPGGDGHSPRRAPPLEPR